MYLHFWLMMYFLFCFGLFMIRGDTLICICFLFHIALIYIYELFMICLYFVLCEIKKLFLFYLFLPHMRLCVC